jgi:iron complex transport system substrate-binding protein
MALLVVTSCDSESDTSDEEPVTTQAGAAEADSGSVSTRTVMTIDGAVDVPADPRRIVALTDQNALLPLLELGVVPIASNGELTADGEEFFRRVDDFDTSGIEWIGPCCDANLEAVAAQSPDLIVTDSFAGGEQLDELVAIASVVRFDPFEQPLVDALAEWAELVGRSDRGAELRADYDARVEEVRAAIGDPSELSVAVVTAFDGQFEYADDSQATGQVVDDLELARPTQRPAEYQAFSQETFPDHVADFVVVYDFGGAEGGDTEIDAFVESPVFRAHPAVAAGQWARVDATETVGSGWSKLSNLLDLLESLLADSDLDRSIDQ